MKEDVILAVKDLSVIYQTDLETVYAVNGVSFTLGRGESLGLVDGSREDYAGTFHNAAASGTDGKSDRGRDLV